MPSYRPNQKIHSTLPLNKTEIKDYYYSSKQCLVSFLLGAWLGTHGYPMSKPVLTIKGVKYKK